ncbi:MAG: tetratricopeptide repeat protein, partial [Thermoplasmata archaeon]|nr:tetratricopeptide repeat protein [Thermoplasmata archaeon]
LREIEEKNKATLENWTGNMDELAPVQEEISKLADVRFLVRRDLEGMMLENERMRIADQALELLVEIARSKSLVIQLEDMHWADESSLFVFNYLARNIRSEKILIIGSMRPHESDILADTLDSMREEGLLTEIELEMFDTGDVSSLVKEMYPGSDFSDNFIESLASQCKGNPFFMTELLRQMGEEGSIGKKDDKYLLLSEDYSIPSSVEDMVYNRLEKLEPDTMMLVEYASCIGREFADDTVKSIQTLGDAAIVLDKLNETGMIISSEGMNEFSHAIFRDVIYDSIGARWRSVYHKSLGEFYEVKYDHRQDEVLYELARHFSASNEFQKAYDYSIRAGEKAESAFAPEQGITFYEKALDILPRLKMGLDAIDREIELREWLGDLYALIGNYESAFEKFDIGEEVKYGSDTRARLLRKIGYVHEKTGNYDGAIETAGRAKELLGDTNYQEQGRILVGEGSAYWRKGEYDSAMKYFIEAYDTFDKVDGADEDSANALRMVGNIYINQGEKELALEYSEKSLALMETIGNLPGIASALNNIGIVHRRKGDLDLALEYQTRSLEIREKTRDKRGIAFSLINLGNLNWDRGDLDTALQNYESSLAIMEAMGDRNGTGLSLSNIGLVHMNRGDMDLALGYQIRGLEIREKIKDKHGIAESLYNIALLHIANDSPDLAKEYFEKCLEIYLELGDKRHTIQSRCGLAEASMMLGE